MERVIDYIGDVKPRWVQETAEMLFYDDMLAMQGSVDYDSDDDWDYEYENEEADDWAN
ncbi:MAG: hypothetical protein ACI4RP_04075 [Acutalibacteraceae bacterium]